MAGYFELVDAPDGGYRIRMLDGSGSLMADLRDLSHEARSSGRHCPWPGRLPARA